MKFEWMLGFAWRWTSSSDYRVKEKWGFVHEWSWKGKKHKVRIKRFHILVERVNLKQKKKENKASLRSEVDSSVKKKKKN